MRTVLWVTAVIALAVLLAGGVALVGCGGSGSSDGTVRVMLTDAPLSGVKEIHVHIVSVQLVGEGGPLVLLDDADIPDDIELLALSGNPALLGAPLVPEGTYTQVRLILSDEEGENWIVTEDDQTIDLTVPSGPQTGVKLITGQFQIVGGQTVILLVDFNAAASVHKAGNSGQWIMKPTVSASVLSPGDLDFGSISGTVLDGTATPLVVPADQVLGVFIDTPLGPLAIAEVNPADGSFSVPALLVGGYDLLVAFADEDWNIVGSPLTIEVNGGGSVTDYPFTLNLGDDIVLTIVVP